VKDELAKMKNEKLREEILEDIGCRQVATSEAEILGESALWVKKWSSST